MHQDDENDDEHEANNVNQPVDDDWPLLLALVVNVAQVEAEGQLKVELQGGALVTPLEGIGESDIDLGTVEGAVSGIELPL